MTTEATVRALMTPGPDPLDALARLLERPAWHRHAACRGHDIALFFPERGARTDEARALCAGCPVGVQCELAAHAGSEEGIWGGTSTAERRKSRAAAKTVPAAVA